ncbi:MULTISPECIES: saccharopine dehydrogenase C-terminal domain-containing protein [unclassified Variovorax]|uniref:homospermidine synthase n=1 Tax=unclassified Variovorax TaxID=663243 RepID=UPI00083861A0|nr:MULTISPECIES: saccharopine dehydrogenase C-terminal domain-containing protein [unclassified Variovorax]PNG58555.1 Homospermidine synthase [Variovorax sp. B4]PNG61655.1 Homospermidine synthase [Variovorax sp. B2]VTV12302.1 Homospermidine synthase [Variovorax sp. WDL1]
MARSNSKTRLKGLLMIGFGAMGQAVLPLLMRHFELDPSEVKIVKTREDESGVAAEYGVEVIVSKLEEGNHAAVLEPLLVEGGFLLNLSVDVSSLALIRLCRQHGVLYLDTCNEPWGGRYDDPSLPLSRRSNYSLREELLAYRLDKRNGPTAVVTQGANPGLVSALVKQALLNMAADNRMQLDEVPASYEEWAALAQKLEIKVIHIAERDTQTAKQRKQRAEFVNTWSVEGFVDEGLQPAELGWGTHERHWPADAERHGFGSDAAIYLRRPGLATRVRSWTPLEGPYHGFLVTHAESISIADHLSLRKDGEVVYRPTVHYAYHPCDDAVLSLHELAGKNWQQQHRHRIVRDEIVEGMDELGVLLMGHPRGVYWFGSRLTIDQARALAPCNNATTLQVVAGILGGMAWALRYPDAGLVEPDDLDHRTVLEAALPYLGEVVGVWGDWTPLKDRSPLFDEDKDPGDPWQFLNFRVS